MYLLNFVVQFRNAERDNESSYCQILANENLTLKHGSAQSSPYIMPQYIYEIWGYVGGVLPSMYTDALALTVWVELFTTKLFSR